MLCIWARLYNLRKNTLNEGHGFSRAANSMRSERGLAPEVLLFCPAATSLVVPYNISVFRNLRKQLKHHLTGL
jgi:hypothetical protein